MTDVDEATALAWHGFHTRLAEVLGQDDERVWLRFGVPVGAEELAGESPWLRVMRFSGKDRMVLWLPGNDKLDPAYALGADAQRFLLDNGWECHDDKAFALRLRGAESGEAAAQAMHALRQVFGVVHPAFLELNAGAERLMGPLRDLVEDDDQDDEDEEACSCPAGAHDLEPWGEDEEPLALVCETPLELLDAARRALVASLGYLPCLDDDGDIPVPGDRAMLWVQATADEPRLELFAPMVDGVRRRGAATIEVGLLNRDQPHLKFRQVDDRIMVRAVVPALPFCPAHLRLVVDRMQTVLRESSGDLAIRCGGEPWAAFDLG